MRNVLCLLLTVLLLTAGLARADFDTSLTQFNHRLDEVLLDYYMDPSVAVDASRLTVPDDVLEQLDPTLAKAIAQKLASPEDLPSAVGFVRATLQQAFTLKMAQAVRAGNLQEARAWRVQIVLPRGVSAVEGTKLLETLGSRADKREEAAQLLTREAITWQTTRVRQLLAEIDQSAAKPVPLPGRLRQRLAEAVTLASLPDALIASAGLNELSHPSEEKIGSLRAPVLNASWPEVRTAFIPLQKTIEASLPSLLSDTERVRVERLLLKLAKLIPREYSAGVREGKVSVELEYREAITFTAQAKQLMAQLAPIWLSDETNTIARKALDDLEKYLGQAESQIAAIAPADDVDATFRSIAGVLENDLGISLRKGGTTADIVNEVMLETRSLLSQSLAAAINGQWAKAESLRLEAYTTYDPELEARLMPRDPQLAMDIELLLLDGIDKPGVKALLDKRASKEELEEAYARVNEALDTASVLLQSGVSPGAAMLNAMSIVLREGLEGLLVIIAILAGLKGAENSYRRKMVWLGVGASMVATLLTWVISMTVITSLRYYSEYIAAITGIIAIIILLLITNWLFHQIYWKQWISTLKHQAAEGESPWQLMSVGFAVGYREGFETVLFLQSLVIDAGGTSIGIGVAIGVVILVALGYAGLQLGWRLPYFKLLLVTAALVGLVLITFTGGTVRALQVISWLPTTRFMEGSLPQWLGTWFGIYNTWECMIGQAFAVALVLGTWRIARFKAKRDAARRRAQHVTQDSDAVTA